MNAIRLIKILDSVLGSFLVVVSARFFPPSRQREAKNNSILIIRPGGIGDAALLIPVINCLQKAFPSSSIHILAEKRNSAVFLLTAMNVKILRYDKIKELFFAMRGSYDIIIDTEQWHRLSAVVARLTRAPMLIGYATNDRRKLFTHSVSYSHDDYEKESFYHLLTPIREGNAWDHSAPFFIIQPDLKEKAKSLFSVFPHGHVVAIFPGSSISERKWGTERFHQTAKKMSSQGCCIVVVGGKEDDRSGAEIIHGLPNALNLCGKLSLPETAAVLQRSSLLITGDSGIMHIGYGLGIKVLALFGPGREKKWAPRGKNCAVINKHLPCSPCTTFGYTPKCRIDAACMKQITVEEVFQEALTLLNKD